MNHQRPLGAQAVEDEKSDKDEGSDEDGVPEEEEWRGFGSGGF